MDSTPLPNVGQGQPFRPSASTTNALIRSARAVRGQQVSRTGRPVLGPDRNADLVYVVNTSGAAVDRYGVLGIGSIAISPADNEPEFAVHVVLNGVTPTIADHSGKFVILLEPIANGQIGRAWISGLCRVKLEITSATDTFADVKASSAELKTGGTGSAQILWKESGTGSGKLGIIRLGNPAQEFPVYLTRNGGSDGSDTVQCSMTYDVYADSAKTQKLNTASTGAPIAPQMQRPNLGPMIAAKIGKARYDAGTLVLIWCDEADYVEVGCG